MYQQMLLKQSVEEKNLVKESDLPVKIEGPYFDIEYCPIRQIKIESEEPVNSHFLMRRPVGRPRKNPKSDFPLLSLVKKEQLEQLRKWLHGHGNLEIQKKKRKPQTPNLDIDNDDIRTRRQRGYKKNMAIPLIDLLLMNPLGYTTKDFTEKVLQRMEATSNSESQDKMRRRIYEFLMVMKTVNVIFSQEDPIPSLNPELVELIKEAEVEDYFNGIDQFFELGKEDNEDDDNAQNQNPNQVPNSKLNQQLPNSNLVPNSNQPKKKKKHKQYNKKKGINLELFLMTEALRKTHLAWMTDKVKQLETLRKNLQDLKDSRKQKLYQPELNYYVRLIIGRQCQKTLPIQYFVNNSNQEPQRPKRFAIFRMNEEYLKGDITMKKGINPGEIARIIVRNNGNKVNIEQVKKRQMRLDINQVQNLPE